MKLHFTPFNLSFHVIHLQHTYSFYYLVAYHVVLISCNKTENISCFLNSYPYCPEHAVRFLYFFINEGKNSK